MDTIEIEVDGQKYRGHYIFENGKVTVWTKGHKVRQLGDTAPHDLAQQLLFEIV